MKVTRFINGNKVSKPLDSKMVLMSDVIPNAIESVNRRLKNAFESEYGNKEQLKYE